MDDRAEAMRERGDVVVAIVVLKADPLRRKFRKEAAPRLERRVPGLLTPCIAAGAPGNADLGAGAQRLQPLAPPVPQRGIRREKGTRLGESGERTPPESREAADRRLYIDSGQHVIPIAAPFRQSEGGECTGEQRLQPLVADIADRARLVEDLADHAKEADFVADALLAPHQQVLARERLALPLRHVRETIGRGEG